MEKNDFIKNSEITIKKNNKFYDYDLFSCPFRKNCNGCEYWVKGYKSKINGYIIVCNK